MTKKLILLNPLLSLTGIYNKEELFCYSASFGILDIFDNTINIYIGINKDTLANPWKRIIGA
jgi:hypothetical protein